MSHHTAERTRQRCRTGNRALSKPNEISALTEGPFVATPTGLIVDGDVSYQMWEAYGGVLQRIETAIQWLVGDWINFGEQAYGEKYAQAIAETPFTYKSLMNMASVARRVELSRRRENLSFSHHAEVAYLEPTAQARWLDKAEAEGLPTRELRRQIREHERQTRIAEGLASLPAEVRDRCNLIHGRFSEVALDLEPSSIDLIIAELPPSPEYLRLSSSLAEHAARLLKPGASLLVTTSPLWLSEVLDQMASHLNVYWIIATLESTDQAPQMWPRRVNPHWRPTLWLVRGDYDGPWIGDVVRNGVTDLIEWFSVPGDLVVDPFCTNGATGLLSLTLNRRFVGVGTDEDAIKTLEGKLIRP